jgi:uncharacterized protein YndB with AHSA1/START domain
MIQVERLTSALPKDVWRVLGDGWLYSGWVVGASRMRDVDEEWPAVGARLNHSIGGWPLLLDDTTTVLEVVPEQRLVLQARGWPVGEARVEIELAPRDNGTLLHMAEDAASGPGKLIPAPLRAAAIGPRNVESLRRLALLAEGRAR